MNVLIINFLVSLFLVILKSMLHILNGGKRIV